MEFSNEISMEFSINYTLILSISDLVINFNLITDKKVLFIDCQRHRLL